MATEVDPLVQKMRDRNGQYMLNLVGTSGATVEEFRRRLKDTHIDYQNDTGIGALWASCWHAAPAIARACLDAGATVDLRSTTGVTPLMMACSAGNVEIVQMLLDHGAYVDEVTPDGHTALTNGLNHRGRQAAARARRQSRHQGGRQDAARAGARGQRHQHLREDARGLRPDPARGGAD